MLRSCAISSAFAAVLLLAGGCRGSDTDGDGTGATADDGGSGATGAGDGGSTGDGGGSGDTGGSGGGTSGDDGATGDDGSPEPPTPGEDTTVSVFDGTHFFFSGWDPGQNMRTIDVEVTFPEAALAYEQVTLSLDLGCPNDRCDWWDRSGWIGVVDDAGTEDESVTEIARFMTPYRVGAEWSFDITHLRPLLAGTVTIRGEIDTWVGPGHQNGDGWLVDATVEMKGGVPDRLPLEVIPVWGLTGFEVGDPANPVADQIPTATVSIPNDATSVDLVSIITGHGQGNLGNCAEFCQKIHGYLVGGEAVQRLVWRDDCDETPVEGQQGTWTYPRAGWCPGAEVLPWIEDVSGGATPGADLTVEYAMEDYENTCRPDAPTCMGCALGTGCEYDGGNHTAPRYLMSVALVAYREL